MSCVLRVFGSDLDIDALMLSVDLKPYDRWYKGEPRSRARPEKLYPNSGALILVSNADFLEPEKQFDDAIAFLTKHCQDLRRLVSFPGVEYAVVDFGIELRDVAIHSDILSPDFLKAAANAGVTVELSHYPGGKEE